MSWLLVMIGLELISRSVAGYLCSSFLVVSVAGGHTHFNSLVVGLAQVNDLFVLLFFLFFVSFLLFGFLFFSCLYGVGIGLLHIVLDAFPLLACSLHSLNTFSGVYANGAFL